MTASEPAPSRLIDRTDIADVQFRYASAVDTRDWDLFKTCFTDEVDVDYSSVLGTPAAHVSVDDLVAAISPVMDRLTATQHLMSNLVITFAGDERATVVAYVRAIHHKTGVHGGTELTVHGYYTNTLCRTDTGWRISKVKLTSTIQTGNPAVFDGVVS